MAGRAKKKACIFKGEKLPQFGADNAKIEAAVQRREAVGAGFSGDIKGMGLISSNDADTRLFNELKNDCKNGGIA